MSEITIAVAVLAGLGSFVAPCILPMVPAFLAYISGTTVAELGKSYGNSALTINRTKIVLNTVFFVTGFSVVFAAIGVAINGILVNSAITFIDIFNQIGGVIIIAFGVFLILSFQFRRLNIERRLYPKTGGASYPVSFLFGLSFAAGWTPCVGPILGTILTLAATTPSAAFHLLLAYSLGLGIPFILIGVFFSKATRIIRAMSRHLEYYSVLLGGLIILLGVLVFTNQLTHLANFPLLNELVLLG